MSASSSARTVRRSPLVSALAVLATAVAALALLLLLRGGTTAAVPRVGSGKETTSAAAVGARVAARASARIPRLITPTDHTAAQRAELDEVDRLARARAAAAVGLTPGEAQKAAGVYRAGDHRRDEIEAELDDDNITKLSQRAPSRLWRHEARVLAEMKAALGEERAYALRAAEADAYEELYRQGQGRPGRTSRINQRQASRRSSAMLYLQATIEGAHDREQPAEEAPAAEAPPARR